MFKEFIPQNVAQTCLIDNFQGCLVTKVFRDWEAKIKSIMKELDKIMCENKGTRGNRQIDRRLRRLFFNLNLFFAEK